METNTTNSEPLQLAWIIHEITTSFRNSGAYIPFSCSESCSGCAHRTKYSQHSAHCKNLLWKKGLVRRFGVSRIVQAGDWKICSVMKLYQSTTTTTTTTF